MKYTKIPTNAFKTLTVNAGIIAKHFDTSTGEVLDADILGATSGGIKFSAVPAFKDWGEDIDNCPKNSKELKRIEDWEITLSGSFVSAGEDALTALLAAADNTESIKPRRDLKAEDFLDELWLIADYGDKDGDYIAIELKNALSTGGLALQTADKEKGKFDFTFTAHYSLADQDNVPCEVFLKTTPDSPTE